MKLLLNPVLALALASASVAARADDALLRQVEDLRDSLPVKDRDQRRALTIKLANLHYTAALDLAGQAGGRPEVAAALRSHQDRAIQLLSDFLGGDSGRFERPAGEQAEAASFELARLYADSEQPAKAKALWEELVGHRDYPLIVSETALSLAELYEAEDPASQLAFDRYGLVLAFEKKADTRTYATYRRAWVLRNQGKFPAAVAELKGALFDAKGQVKEAALTDLVVFYSLSDLPQPEALAYFQALDEKLSRTDLPTLLADAYIAAGNKPAAVATLAVVTAAHPTLLHVVRLLEESYGVRDWVAFRGALARAAGQDVGGLPEPDQREILKVLKRLAVQLDAEQRTQAATAPEFVQTAALFLRLFPGDEDAAKILGSAVAAEQTPAAKALRLEQALATPALALAPAARLALGEQLVSLYQGLGDHAAAAKRAGTLAAGASGPDQRRLAFVQASELVDGGKGAEALPLLKALAKANPGDDIGGKSQLMAVRVLGKSGDYAAVVAASTAWITAVGQTPGASGTKEYQAVAEIRDRSEFEASVAQGEQPAALAVFVKDCVAGLFAPKACDNAKTLALKLKRYDALIAVLKYEKRDQELAAVYEAGGYFGEAATIYEAAMPAEPERKELLHLALLFELAGRAAERDLLLNRLLVRLGKEGFHGSDEEQLLLATFKDASLVSPRLLPLAWSPPQRCVLLGLVAQTQPGLARLRDNLLACDSYAGKPWAAAVVALIDDLDAKQRQIAFAGSGSQHKFEQRLKALNGLTTAVDRYLAGADRATYLTLAGKAQAALTDLAAAIDQTAVPVEAPPETVPAIKAQIAAMSAPFKERSAAYAALLGAETARAAQAEVPPPVMAAGAPAALQANIVALHTDPESRVALTKIYEHFQGTGQARLAAYFRGRLNQLEQAH